MTSCCIGSTFFVQQLVPLKLSGARALHQLPVHGASNHKDAVIGGHALGTAVPHQMRSEWVIDISEHLCRDHDATVRQLSTSAWAAQEALAVAHSRARTATARADAAAAECQQHKVSSCTEPARMFVFPFLSQAQHDAG